MQHGALRRRPQAERGHEAREQAEESVKGERTCPIQTLQICLIFLFQTKLLNVSLGRSDILSRFGFNDPSVQDGSPQMQCAYFSQITNSEERLDSRTALTMTSGKLKTLPHPSLNRILLSIQILRNKKGKFLEQFIEVEFHS